MGQLGSILVNVVYLYQLGVQLGQSGSNLDNWGQFLSMGSRVNLRQFWSIGVKLCLPILVNWGKLVSIWVNWDQLGSIRINFGQLGSMRSIGVNQGQFWSMGSIGVNHGQLGST